MLPIAGAKPRQHAWHLQVPPGLELCDEDDAADCCWLMHEGEVSARTRAGPASSLRSPALLGQTAILQEQTEQYFYRPCSYRWATVCCCMRMCLAAVSCDAILGALHTMGCRSLH